MTLISKLVTINLTAFDYKGWKLCNREYKLDKPLNDACDDALEQFTAELVDSCAMDKTVRITQDIALSEEWWMTEAQQADQEAKLTAAGPGEARAVGPGDPEVDPVPSERDDEVDTGPHDPRNTD